MWSVSFLPSRNPARATCVTVPSTTRKHLLSTSIPPGTSTNASVAVREAASSPSSKRKKACPMWKPSNGWPTATMLRSMSKQSRKRRIRNAHACTRSPYSTNMKSFRSSTKRTSSMPIKRLWPPLLMRRAAGQMMIYATKVSVTPIPKAPSMSLRSLIACL